jgi:AcrR family transcriptional regulator
MIVTKAAKTSQYILQTVSPIFNKNGYSGTSISDITSATGLTKGAIYGNFKNKEALALEAFNFNVQFIVDKIKSILNDIESPIAKLFALTNFYRSYYIHSLPKGGCPLLNVAIDSNNTNPELFHSVKLVMKKLTDGIAKMIAEGINKGEIKSEIDSVKYGGRIYCMIEGAVFASMTLKDDTYLMDMMNHIDKMIQTELQV